MKAIKAGKNKQGESIIIAIITGKQNFSVWIQKENYSLGQMVKSWCCIKKDITLEEAEVIFKRRTK